MCVLLPARSDKKRTKGFTSIRMDSFKQLQKNQTETQGVPGCETSIRAAVCKNMLSALLPHCERDCFIPV